MLSSSPREKLSKLLVLICIFLLPAQLAKHFWPAFSYINGLKIDYLAPKIYSTDILLIILIVLNLPILIKFLKKIYSHTHKLILLSPILFWFLSSPPLPLLYSLLKISFTVAGVFIVSSYISRTKTASYILSVSLLLQASLSLYQWLSNQSFGSIFYFLGERDLSLYSFQIAKTIYQYEPQLRAYGTFSHPNSLSGFSVLSLILIWYITPNTPHKNIIRLISIMSTVVIVLITVSQNTYLSIILLVILLIFIRTHRVKIYYLFIPLIFCLTAPLILNIFAYHPSIHDRLITYKQLPNIISNHPLGLGPYQHLYQLPSFGLNNIANLQPIHNIIYILILEFGLIFTFLILSKLYHLRHTQIPKTLFLGLSFVLFTGTFDHYWLTLFQNQQLLLLFIFTTLAHSNPARITTHGHSQNRLS